MNNSLTEFLDERPDVRRAVDAELLTALKWRGWDRKCECHACRYIRSIADVLIKAGIEVEEYT